MRKLAFLIVLLALYVGYGYYTNNFYQDVLKKRQETTRANPDRLNIILAHSPLTSDSFLTGAEVALSDLSGASVSLDLQTIEVSPSDRSVNALSTNLRHDTTVSALVANLPTEQEDALAVVSETYGVGALLVSSRSTFVSSAGFRYVDLVDPSFDAIARGVFRQLPLICRKEPGEVIRYGLLFDREEQDGDALVNAVVRSGERFNEGYQTTAQLRSSLVEGLLKREDLLSQVAATYFLSTRVADDRPALHALVNDFCLQHGPETTVEEALAATEDVTNPLQSYFTQAFTSSRIDPATLSSVVNPEDELDCLLVVGELKRIQPAIQELRTLFQSKPIVVLDYENAAWLESNYGSLAQGLFLVTSVDVEDSNPRMQAFRESFSRQAGARGRQVQEPDEAAVLGYEAVSMLHQVSTEHKTTVPVEVMTLLGQLGPVWQGLGLERIGFDRVGDGAGREVYLITLDGNRLRYVRKEDGL